MVKSISLLFICLSLLNNSYSQDIGRDINNYIQFSIFLNDDSLSYHDTLEVSIEMTNNTTDTITIYPEGIVYLRLSYTDYHKELILISNRKTGNTEKLLLPFEKILLKYEICLENNGFLLGMNKFSVVYISYPYWLKKRDRRNSIFGKWESELNELFVL